MTVELTFEKFHQCEEILSTSRYLCGATFTLADIRLFMTLIRFDLVYIVYFKVRVCLCVRVCGVCVYVQIHTHI